MFAYLFRYLSPLKSYPMKDGGGLAKIDWHNYCASEMPEDARGTSNTRDVTKVTHY